MIVIGNVRTTKIGLITALTNPITTAATRAATKLLTLNPSTKLAVIINDTAVISQVSKKCGMTLVEKLPPISYILILEAD
jgi:hypothetical protein